jgi:hypothetical protein
MDPDAHPRERLGLHSPQVTLALPLLAATASLRRHGTSTHEPRMRYVVATSSSSPLDGRSPSALPAK